MNLTLQFSHNRSKYFNDVIKACDQFRNFTCNEGKYTLETTMLECLQNFEHLETIATIATKWVSFKYQLGYNVVNQRHEFLARIYYPLQSIMQCINNKEKSIECDYCTGGKGWGCAKLNDVNLIPTYYSSNNWFDYGYLKDGMWIIDKNKLAGILAKEADLKLLHTCPYFNNHTTKTIIDALPDEIDVATKNWEFKKQLVFDHSIRDFKNEVIGLNWIGDIEDFRIYGKGE